MKKKKIIIFAPLLGGGGVEKNLVIISNYLSTKYEHVSLITASREFGPRFNKKINFITPNKNFLSKIKNRRLKIILCIFMLIKEYIINSKFTVISFQANLYCCLICNLLKIKVILRSNASITGWAQTSFRKIIFSKILNTADAIVVNSKEFQQEYKKKFNIKTICIYNPLDTKNILYNSKKKIKFNFFNKKTINLINIGRLVDQKDQMTLLKSIKILRKNKKLKIKLLIIGNGIQKNLLYNYIIKNNLKKIVKILNFKKNPYPYIKKSDVFILTSLFEGLPNVLIESLALKKIVISSDCPTGPKEILDNGKGGLLFKKGDEIDLSNKIMFYIENKKYCKKLMKYGNRRLKRFDYLYNLSKYENLFNF